MQMLYNVNSPIEDLVLGILVQKDKGTKRDMQFY